MGENKVNHRIIQESRLNEYPISILVPIYNVEKYLRRCLDSLFTQTYANIEYIFIHDCGTDNSFAILLDEIEKHPSRKQDCTIIENTQNLGISTTRNKLIHYAKGTYSLFVDSDDWIIKNAVELLLTEAYKGDYDLVGGHIIEEYLTENKIEQKKITINYPDDYTERLINSFSTSHNHPLYTQIIKHQLYKEHNIHIPFNIQFGEDLILLINIYYYAKKISSIPVYFYHYNKFNTNSLTYTHSKKQLIERIKYTDYMTSFALKNNILEIVGEDIAERKHIVRSLLLLQPELRDIEKAKHTYPEAKGEWRRFKQYYSKKNRFIFLLAEHGWYFLIKLIYRK